MRFLSLIVGFVSLGIVLVTLLLAGPHSDLPGQPATSIIVALLTINGGGALVRALWRRRPAAAWGLPVWAGTLAILVLGLTDAIASPAERVQAQPALLVGLSLWALLTLLVTRYVRRRVTAAG